MGKQLQLNAYGEVLGSLQAYQQEATACTDSRRKQKMLAALGKILRQELTEKQRQAATLYYFRQMTVPQIARQLGVNKSTVSRHLQAARNKIALCMKYWAL